MSDKKTTDDQSKSVQNLGIGLPNGDKFEGYFKVTPLEESEDFHCKVNSTEAMDDIPAKLTDYYELAEETSIVIEELYSEDRIKVKPENEEAYNKAKAKMTAKKRKYIKELIRISEVGLNGLTPQPALATKSLNKLREEIMIKDGGKIKNKYFTKLGIWAIVFAVLFAGLAIFIKGMPYEKADADEPKQETVETTDKNMDDDGASINADEKEGIFHGNVIYAYLFAAAGSAIGTWISYGARKKKLDFMDLVVMEEDRINSVMRILFIAFVSVVFMMFLASGVLDFAVGDIKMSDVTAEVNVEYQLVIGVIAGILGNNLVGGLYKKTVELTGFEEKK